jgi:opacity protein-like surface antigen
MKKPFRTLAICSLGAAALACSSGALAQSYWRIDGGISKSRKADFREEGTVLTCGNIACTDPAVFDDLKSASLLDFGWGYRFGRFFRSDITLAFRSGYGVDANDKTSVPSSVKADIKSTAVMLSLYFDFPTASGVNPYFGLGVGASQNRVSDITVTSGAVPDTVFSAPGGKKTNGAGALMAGISFETRGGGAIEFGFRVIDLGKIETDAGTTTTTTAGASSTGLAFSGMKGRLRATEWTIGVRF